MKLMLDIGNSSVNWANEKKSKFIDQGSFVYDKKNFENSLEENIVLTKNITTILVSNVAGQEIFTSLDSWAKEHGCLKLWQPVVDEKFKGLNTNIYQTQDIGVDRWLSMVACWEMHQSSLCVVNCGTALTIDLINVERGVGNHLGGYILPGVDLLQSTLIKNTKNINFSINSFPSIEYPSDTKTAVNNGAFLALVSSIDRVVNGFKKDSGRLPKCIISGGNAKLIESLLEHKFEYIPNLVLHGLLITHNTSI